MLLVTGPGFMGEVLQWRLTDLVASITRFRHGGSPLIRAVFLVAARLIGPAASIAGFSHGLFPFGGELLILGHFLAVAVMFVFSHCSEPSACWWSRAV